MRWYSFIQYEFVECKPCLWSLEFVTSFTMNPTQFDNFLFNNLIYQVTFLSGLESVHDRCHTVEQFYNGCYKNVTLNQQFMICVIDL